MCEKNDTKIGRGEIKVLSDEVLELYMKADDGKLKMHVLNLN